MKAYTSRYDFPQKSIKSDCPACGSKNRKTLSRYVDTKTGDVLPEEYGRCDRRDNCGYYLNPYHEDSSGLSYADKMYQLWRNEQQRIEPALFVTRRPKESMTRKAQPSEPTVYSIPEEVFTKSLSHYERNQFAKLLCRHFGASMADDLLTRFQIGTSSRWYGACVFWYIDEENRKRGGQIKLFGDDWHTVKYVNSDGQKRIKISWVQSALKYQLEKAGQPIPIWLSEYDLKAERSPCLFGLPQLKTAPSDQPIAIVEAPKTAVLCSYYFPKFIWLAAGSKSYLNAERLAPIKNRRIVLFPDVNAYYDLVNDTGQVNQGWLAKANDLHAKGFSITVSNYLEERASQKEKQNGLDLADYLLNQWKGYPPDWDELLPPNSLPTSSMKTLSDYVQP